MSLCSCAQVADISDVVRQRADALMLSGESAVGAYPDKAVNVLRQVATRIEEWVRCVASLTGPRPKSQEPGIMALFTPADKQSELCADSGTYPASARRQCPRNAGMSRAKSVRTRLIDLQLHTRSSPGM